jgi:hypothetical protein
MATFFKYKERDDISKSMIDWSGLTKKISDDLVGEKSRRDELKFKIEQDQQEKLKAVENVYQGIDPTMNQKMIELANNYKDYLVQQHDLMKRGLISVNDTKITKQGAIDTFNAINDVAKGYGEKMQTLIDKGGNANEFIAEKLAGVLNIANSTLIIDPKSGRGTFVTTDESGNEIAIPATAFSNVLNQTYERFDDKKVVADAVKNLGDYIKADSAYLSISDVRQNKPYYDEWKSTQINSILSNDNNVISAAADYLGMFPTIDKELVKNEPDKYFLAEAKGEKIVFNTEGLRDKIAKKLDADIEVAVSREEKRTAPPQMSTAEIAARGADKTEKETFESITAALQGDRAALQELSNQYGFKSITPIGDGRFSIITQAGETMTIDPSEGMQSAGASFASALGLSGRNYRNQVKTTEAISPKFSSNTQAVRYTTPAPIKISTRKNIEDFQSAFKTEKETIKAGDKVTVTKTQDEIDQTATNTLNAIIGEQGLSATISGNDVTVNGQILQAKVPDYTGILREIELTNFGQQSNVDAFGNPIE